MTAPEITQPRPKRPVMATPRGATSATTTATVATNRRLNRLRRDSLIRVIWPPENTQTKVGLLRFANAPFGVGATRYLPSLRMTLTD
jgi:hypothetical protein